MKSSKSLLAVAALSLTLQAQADCYAPTTKEQPEVPNGAAASEREMLSAQNAIKGYVSDTEAYLECANLPDVTHNAYVSRLNNIAGRYNRELSRFVDRDVVAGLQ